MYREQRGNGHIPQGSSVTADDATGINTQDGLNQEMKKEIKTKYSATWMALYYKLEVTTLVPRQVLWAHAHKRTSLITPT